MKEDFYTKGFINIRDESCYNMIHIDSLNWGEKGTVGVRKQLGNPGIEIIIDCMQDYIKDSILSNFWNDVITSKDDIEVVEGMDAATLEWHHDFYEGKSNCGVLVYYDSMDEDTGGSLSIKRANDKDHKVITFYPTAGDIVILNQGTDFLHRVDPIKMNVPRRVALFHYWVE